jgi:hypothetical protein
MASTAAVTMDMAFTAAAAIGIMADSTVTIGSVAEAMTGSVADFAEVMNFTAAMASMEEAQSVAVAEAMAADTGNRSFFA